MANDNKKVQTILNKAIFSPDGRFILKLDGCVTTEISGSNGQYTNFDTAFFVKAMDRNFNEKEDVAKVFISSVIALSMSRGILDRVSGTATSNFEAVLNKDATSYIRAGIFDSGYGVQLTIGETTILLPLGKNEIIGFAELVKVFVQAAEGNAAARKIKHDSQRNQQSSYNG